MTLPVVELASDAATADAAVCDSHIDIDSGIGNDSIERKNVIISSIIQKNLPITDCL